MRWLTLAAVALAGYAALVALVWLCQRKLIYFPTRGALPPPAALLPGAEDVGFPAADGVRLRGWFVPAKSPPGRCVIVCNGNAGDRSHRAPLARALAARGFAVLLFDYRGYGDSGGDPSEAGLLADLRAARAYVRSRPDVVPEGVILFGESLGAAVATASAAEQPPAALVLRSPFTSLAAIGALHYPFLPVRLLLRDRFPVAAQIQSVRCPLLVVAGDRDRIVPAAESRAVFDRAGAPRKRFLLVAGADHNDALLAEGPGLVEPVVRFLAEALP